MSIRSHRIGRARWPSAAAAATALACVVPAASAQHTAPVTQIAHLQRDLRHTSRLLHAHQAVPARLAARISRTAGFIQGAFAEGPPPCRAALRGARRVARDRRRRQRLKADVRVALRGLPACEHHPHPHPAPAPSATPAPTPTPAPATTVTGSVQWPDGAPAARVHLEFFPQGFSLDWGTPYAELQADADGRYLLPDCPCQDLVGWLMVPQNHGPTIADGGRDCWLPMETGGTIGGVAAHPGDTMNWQALDAPCDDVPYNPSSARDVIAALIEQQDAPDHQPDSGWAGTWQDARRRLG